MTITPKPSYSTSEIRNVAQRGQLLQIRSGAVIADHADTAATASEFGTALTTAIAALQAGDTLHMRGFEASGKNWDVTTNNVRIIAEEVTLLPQANWDFALRLNTIDDCYVQGLHVDGKSTANTGLGICYWINGDRNVLRGNSSANTRGQTAQAASVWQYTGDDCAVFNHESTNDAWFGVAAGGNRFVLDGFRCIDPISRALNPFAPVAALDYQVYRSIYAVQTVALTSASIMFNANFDNPISDLYLEDFFFHHGDNYLPGYSWNDGAGVTAQMAKWQNTTRMHMKNGWINHGRNEDTGNSLSWRIDSPPEVGIDELYVDNVYHAGAISLTDNQTPVKYMRFTNCHFGGRNSQFFRGLVGRFKCADFLAESCTFNSHDIDCFDIDTEHEATDWFRVLNCRFLSNHASNRYVLLPASAESLAANIGRVVFYNNTLDNTGAGTMYRADNEFEELALTTDASGNLLFDAALVGTGAGKHPAPGAGPNYFSGLTVPSQNGVRIYNTEYTTGGGMTYPERVWVSNAGTNWKNGT